MKILKCLFKINSSLKTKDPIAILINLKSDLTDEDKCKEMGEKERDYNATRYCNMTETDFMTRIGLNPKTGRKGIKNLFSPPKDKTGQSDESIVSKIEMK